MHVRLFGHDAARLAAQAAHRTPQRPAVFLRHTRIVLADAHRHAVQIQKLRPVTGGEVLEQVRPHQHAKQPALRHRAGLGFMPMHYPAQRLQWLTDATPVQANVFQIVIRHHEVARRPLVEPDRHPQR
ncbi:hypothetical protein D3C77_564600 [compost metagenome]